MRHTLRFSAWHGHLALTIQTFFGRKPNPSFVRERFDWDLVVCLRLRVFRAIVRRRRFFLDYFRRVVPGGRVPLDVSDSVAGVDRRLFTAPGVLGLTLGGVLGQYGTWQLAIIGALIIPIALFN